MGRSPGKMRIWMRWIASGLAVVTLILVSYPCVVPMFEQWNSAWLDDGCLARPEAPTAAQALERIRYREDAVAVGAVQRAIMDIVLGVHRAAARAREGLAQNRRGQA